LCWAAAGAAASVANERTAANKLERDVELMGIGDSWDGVARRLVCAAEKQKR
jgi:hypothetical protein